MISKIFVNLPVKDLDKSMAFFKAVGFSFNPQFTDENAACHIRQHPNDREQGDELCRPRQFECIDGDRDEFEPPRHAG